MKIVLLFVFLSALFDGSSSQSYEFIFVSLPKSWFDAQMYCRHYYTDLAVIKDQTDHNKVIAFGGTEKVWIGLYRTTTNNPWMWSDQSKITFIPWANGEPSIITSTSPVCVRASTAGWHDSLCTNSYPFVCYHFYGDSGSFQNSPIIPAVVSLTTVKQQQQQQEMKKKQMLRLEVKSDQNVNDPAVMTEVLEKMEQILKMKGLDENATLSWKIQSDGNVFQKYQERNVTEQPCHS